MSTKWEMWEADRHRSLQIKEEWCFQKLFYWYRGRLKPVEADVTGYDNNKSTQNRNCLVLLAIGRSVLQRFSGSGYLPEVMMKKQTKCYEVGKDSTQSAVQLAVEFPKTTVKFQIDEPSKLRKTLDFSKAEGEFKLFAKNNLKSQLGILNGMEELLPHLICEYLQLKISCNAAKFCKTNCCHWTTPGHHKEKNI